ncbi:MAG: T9SS type A sorting domain-containing protein, partial [Ferruginibacter sp.]
FDGDGKLTTDIATFNDYGCAVAIQVNGRIIVAGYCETLSTNNDFALARYNSDGSVDNSFDGDGKSITNINAFDYGYALKLSGLRIYLGGQSHDDVFTIVAYQNDALPLALQLTAFAAHRQNHSIILNWQTASEQNSSYFSIERSSDGFLFTSIGNKPAAGNSQTSRNYSFTDVTPGKGTNYYRLKQIDLDGKFIYSSIVTVSNKDGSTKTFLAPNPATDHTLLVFSKPTKKMLVTIFTSSGQLVKIIPIADDQNQQLINVTSLPKGEYTIRITNDEATEVLKLVKQ